MFWTQASRAGCRTPTLAHLAIPNAISLHSELRKASCGMASIARAAAAIAAVLVREGIDYAQSKAVFKAARARAGLRAVPERRGGVDRLTVEEELRFLDQAYARGGKIGLMLQTLLETGARASELVQLRVEDVSLAERVITIQHGKGGKRREVPIRRDLAQLLWLADVVQPGHVGAGLAAGDDAFGDLAPLGRIQLLAAAAHTPFGPGNRQAGRSALTDHRPLELGEAGVTARFAQKSNAKRGP